MGPETHSDTIKMLIINTQEKEYGDFTCEQSLIKSKLQPLEFELPNPHQYSFTISKLLNLRNSDLKNHYVYTSLRLWTSK